MVRLWDKLPNWSRAIGNDFLHTWLRQTWQEEISLRHWIPEVIACYLRPEATHTLDEGVWHLGGYRTIRDARNDLSRACVQFGRALVGLPELNGSNDSIHRR
jgi:hypothetical protein